MAKELGNDSIYIDVQTPLDKIINNFKPNQYAFADNGNSLVNDLLVGYYVMGDGFSKKQLTFLSNNTAKLAYVLPESGRLIYEVGFWRSTSSSGIEMRIVGSQFGMYKAPRRFVFEVQDDGKKIVSTNYDSPIYGSGGLVFYKK